MAFDGTKPLGPERGREIEVLREAYKFLGERDNARQIGYVFNKFSDEEIAELARGLKARLAARESVNAAKIPEPIWLDPIDQLRVENLRRAQSGVCAKPYSGPARRPQWNRSARP